MHLRLVLSRGINEYPEPGKPVEKETYDAYYEEIIKKEGVPFVPDAIGKDLIFAALVLIAILVCSAVFGPQGPSGPPDPTRVDTVPRPDFYFLSIFAMLALLPDWMETIVLFFFPALMLAFLLALPFISGTGEKSYKRRPVAVLSVLLIGLTLGTMTYLGSTGPWSPEMNAWSGDAIPQQDLTGRTPLEMRGATVLQNKQCRNCHSLGGYGGQRGPALDDVATRLTGPELVRQVIQGGGNMPAYGKNLNPAEVDALVSYLMTLRPNYRPPARDSAMPASPANPGSEGAPTGSAKGLVQPVLRGSAESGKGG
jgi:ubiquinol-cytochrome c reductase cytochrome b subunit